MKNLCKLNNKSESGISLITLIITIVVIIILALITLRGGGDQINEAAIADYKYELKGIEISVASARVVNQQDGIGEEFKEEGFYPVIIENPPKDFAYFEGWDIHGYRDGECYGYVVDLNYIEEEGTKKGYDYEKYQTFDVNKTITFGKDGKDNDVYIYDATGKVYYAKGYYVEDGVYYSDILTKDGPIITIQKDYDATANVVNLTITVKAEENDTNLKLRIDGTLIEKEADGTYKYEVTKNGTYMVTAEEDLERVSTKRVTVTEIKEATYIITYHFNDGVTENQTQTKSESEVIRLVPPVKVIRDGYVLKGFSKNSAATTAEYKVGQLFSENADTDLYAVWEEGTPEKYTITFNPNGGKGAPASISKTEGEAVSLPTLIPTRTGYAFGGWSKSSTNEDPDGIYAAGSEYAEEGNTVLFAVWQSGNVKVEIEVEPPEAGSVAGSGDKKAGNYVYITATANSGYSFERWSIKEGSTNAKIENVYAEKTRFTMPNDTVTLIAKFKETDYDYKIKYNANNGTGAPNTQYKKRNVDITISNTVPTRSGYTFIGWTDTLSSETVKYLPMDTYSKDENVTLYALWSKNAKTYTVNFDANGGTIEGLDSSITSKEVLPGETYGTLPKVTRTGYTFLGWYTKLTGGSIITSDSIVSESANNHTLYAIWQKEEKIEVLMEDYTYAGTKEEPSISGYTGSGTVTYYYNDENSTSGGTAWSTVTSSISLDAGTYYMYAVITETDSTKTIDATKFTIEKAQGYITLDSYSVTATSDVVTTTVTSSHGGAISVKELTSYATIHLTGTSNGKTTVSVYDLVSYIDSGSVVEIQITSAATTNYTEGKAIFEITIGTSSGTGSGGSEDGTEITCPSWSDHNFEISQPKTYFDGASRWNICDCEGSGLCTSCWDMVYTCTKCGKTATAGGCDACGNWFDDSDFTHSEMYN